MLGPEYIRQTGLGENIDNRYPIEEQIRQTEEQIRESVANNNFDAVHTLSLRRAQLLQEEQNRNESLSQEETSPDTLREDTVIEGRGGWQPNLETQIKNLEREFEGLTEEYGRRWEEIQNNNDQERMTLFLDGKNHIIHLPDKSPYECAKWDVTSSLLQRLGPGWGPEMTLTIYRDYVNYIKKTLDRTR